MNIPNRLDFTSEELEGLLTRLDNKSLRGEDYPLLCDVLKAMVWLGFSLKERELTIKRLRQIFGVKTESASKLFNLMKGQGDSTSSEDNTNKKEDPSGEKDTTKEKDSSEESPSEKEKEPTKNHGHRPSSSYTEAKTIHIAHQSLKKGDICPECLKGKLYQLKPGTVLRIVGQPWLQVEIYKPERLRCALCQKIFTAKLPDGVAGNSRSDYAAKAIVTLLKYRGGIPFYRQGQVQEILGAPVSASEIWEMTEDVANALQPIHSVLCQMASNAPLIHNDDTTAKILSRMKELKKLGEEAERTGTFTTGIVAIFDETGVTINLFFTGKNHAGENLNNLLNDRDKNLVPPIQQCDALSCNGAKDHETQLSNCLAHLRRKFYELIDYWPKVILKIIGDFSEIFVNDQRAPDDPEERLKWHQEKTKPIMEGIKKFCNNLVEEKKVEPNSSLGKAIAYLNAHWEAFTLFLCIPGVPLTNNKNERLLKRAVLNRKNAYFFRNETGAKIADILMSVLETCISNKINPHDYLISVQKYRQDVSKNPQLWVPWLYGERLKTLLNVTSEGMV